MSKTTPNLGLPYPELTDTADVPRDVKALADKLDALLGGGGGGGGSGTLPLANAPVLNVGQVGQVRAGRQLTVADFTSLGLSAPIGLWNLSDLTNLGTDGNPLVNLGTVPFDTGINGLATTAARFSGNTGQALWIDPSPNYAIRTGSWGCWFRTAKRGQAQGLITRLSASQSSWSLDINSDKAQLAVSTDGTTLVSVPGVSDVADDRWHFAVATHDGTTLRLYVDGVLEVTGTLGPIATVAAPLNIGARSANSGTSPSIPNFGRIDEAFVTADVLTDDQVRLLYAAKLGHALGTLPTGARLSIHRRRKGAAFAVTDFPTQPLRLHNFTAGALTDQGSGGVALTNAYTTLILSVGGADGTPGSAYSFGGAHQGLTATDTGLPGGLTARSYGGWFKTGTATGSIAIMGWGATASRDVLYLTNGVVQSGSAADFIAGPFVADGQWHFAVTAEDNTATDLVKRKIYVDGRLVATSTVLGSITLGGATQPRFRIGADVDGTLPFTGQIDAAFVCGYALTSMDIYSLYAKGSQDLGASPKNTGDHVERLDATSVLFIGDTLESQWTVDLGVVA